MSPPLHVLIDIYTTKDPKPPRCHHQSSSSPSRVARAVSSSPPSPPPSSSSSRGICHVTLARRHSHLFIASLSGNEISDFAHLTPLRNTMVQRGGEGAPDGIKTALQASARLPDEQIRKEQGPSISISPPLILFLNVRRERDFEIHCAPYIWSTVLSSKN